MKALRDLKRFIAVKCQEGEHAEVRAYVVDHLEEIAAAFGVRPGSVETAIGAVDDDSKLASQLRNTIESTEKKHRADRIAAGGRSASASAATIASQATWVGGRAFLDMSRLVDSALTRRNDVLVFTCDDFAVSVPMAPLCDLQKNARARCELSGFVDHEGVHLRWRTGGLNLRPRLDLKGEQVVVDLPPRAREGAAA